MHLRQAQNKPPLSRPFKVAPLSHSTIALALVQIELSFGHLLGVGNEEENGTAETPFYSFFSQLSLTFSGPRDRFELDAFRNQPKVLGGPTRQRCQYNRPSAQQQHRSRRRRGGYINKANDTK
jgi:hypothetical protein